MLYEVITLSARYGDDLTALRRIRLQNLGQPYLNRLHPDPNDAGALLQLGIIYARHEEPREALASYNFV